MKKKGCCPHFEVNRGKCRGDERSASYSQWARGGLSSTVFVDKVVSQPHLFIYILPLAAFVVQTAPTYVVNCNTDTGVAYKAKSIYYLAFYRRNLPIPSLHS